jgi:hypothetical protein
MKNIIKIALLASFGFLSVPIMAQDSSSSDGSSTPVCNISTEGLTNYCDTVTLGSCPRSVTDNINKFFDACNNSYKNDQNGQKGDKQFEVSMESIFGTQKSGCDRNFISNPEKNPQIIFDAIKISCCFESFYPDNYASMCDPSNISSFTDIEPSQPDDQPAAQPTAQPTAQPAEQPASSSDSSSRSPCDIAQDALKNYCINNFGGCPRAIITNISIFNAGCKQYIESESGEDDDDFIAYLTSNISSVDKKFYSHFSRNFFDKDELSAAQIRQDAIELSCLFKEFYGKYQTAMCNQANISSFTRIEPSQPAEQPTAQPDSPSWQPDVQPVSKSELPPPPTECGFGSVQDGLTGASTQYAGTCNLISETIKDYVYHNQQFNNDLKCLIAKFNQDCLSDFDGLMDELANKSCKLKYPSESIDETTSSGVEKIKRDALDVGCCMNLIEENNCVAADLNSYITSKYRKYNKKIDDPTEWMFYFNQGVKGYCIEAFCNIYDKNDCVTTDEYEKCVDDYKTCQTKCAQELGLVQIDYSSLTPCDTTSQDAEFVSCECDTAAKGAMYAACEYEFSEWFFRADPDSRTIMKDYFHHGKKWCDTIYKTTYNDCDKCRDENVMTAIYSQACAENTEWGAVDPITGSGTCDPNTPILSTGGGEFHTGTGLDIDGNTKSIDNCLKYEDYSTHRNNP